MQTLLQDVRYAVRNLRRSPTFTLVVVLSLALGIGANTTLFSAINTQLLRTIPAADPDGLVRLRWFGDNDMTNNRSSYGYVANAPGGERASETFSYPIFEQLRESNQTLTDMFASSPFGSVNVVVDGEADIASAFIASGSYFNVIGVGAAAGRTITMEDDQATAAPVAMISYGYWSRRFGEDPGVVGRTVSINDVPVTIVGVTPPEYTGIRAPAGNAFDVHFPLALDLRLSGPERLNEPTWWWLQLMGRLKSGVGPEQVRDNFEGVFQRAAQAGMDSSLQDLSTEEREMSRNQGRTAVPSLWISSGRHGIYDVGSERTRPIAILSAVVVLVLLIVCANVANLLLSRATARGKEISIRVSMGATRARLVRQLLTEGVVLALTGGSLGVLVAYWGRQLLPRGQTADLDWTVFLFVAALSMLTGLAFSLVPALRATRLDLASTLKETSRSGARSKTRLSKALLVGQVAVSLVLLIGAGLFLATFRNLRNVDVGFDPDNILLFRVNPGLIGYEDDMIASLYDRMKERLGVVPAVRSVSLSERAFLSGGIRINRVHFEGQEVVEGPSGVAHMMIVSPEFFETMQIPVLAGRTFDTSDDADAPRVAMINDTAARQFLAGENPLGSRFGYEPEEASEIEVVGVVRDVKYANVRDAEPPTLYLPYLQFPFGSMIFELRTAMDPQGMIAEIQEAVREIDPNLPVMNVSTQVEEIEQRYSQERYFAQSYSLFGGLAVLLTSIGLFGLASYNVVRRTNEIGIRMALGARGRDVTRMVLGESLKLVLLGVVIGLIAALAAGRLVASLLFGLAPADGLTITLAMLVMIAVSSFASYLPARRASRVDPIKALRYE